MSVPVVAAADVVLCAHGGMVKPATFDPRVRISGQPVLSLASTSIITGCPTGSCVNVKWVTGALRVRASGVPLLVMSSVGIATPAGAPVRVLQTSPRVRAL